MTQIFPHDLSDSSTLAYDYEPYDSHMLIIQLEY